MDLNLLHIFSVIYRERNLTRTAECLGVTRPAVSAALRRLRGQFRDPLFIRKAHGVEPTVYAEAIAEKLALAMSLVDEVTRPADVFHPAEAQRKFVLGMSDYCQAVILPVLLRRLRHEAPGISLCVRHPGNQGARRALDDGVFDLLIGNVQAPLERIRQQKLLVENFTGLVSPFHPLAHHRVGADELNRYPALLTEGPGNDRWWENAVIKDSGFAPQLVHSVPDFLAIPHLLHDSMLVGVTAKRLWQNFSATHSLTEIPLPFGEVPITIRQYWHERWHTDPAHRWLRRTIHQLCQSL